VKHVCDVNLFTQLVELPGRWIDKLQGLHLQMTTQDRETWTYIHDRSGFKPLIQRYKTIWALDRGKTVHTYFK